MSSHKNTIHALSASGSDFRPPAGHAPGATEEKPQFMGAIWYNLGNQAMRGAALTAPRISPQPTVLEELSAMTLPKFTIPLTQGYETEVDADSHESLSAFKWYAAVLPTGVYACRKVRINGKKITIPMHRQILGLAHGDGMTADHRNGDTLDNRRSNLRLCTEAENNRNKRVSKNNVSGYKGVKFDKRRNRYTAVIEFEGRAVHIGCFDNPIDAARAYDRKAKELHGEFAWLNFPD